MNEKDLTMRAELLLIDIVNCKPGTKMTLKDAKKDKDWNKAVDVVKQRFIQWKDLYLMEDSPIRETS